MAAELQAQFERHGSSDSDSLFFKYRTTLAKVIESAEFKEFSKDYRLDVASTIERYGRRQRDQARWEHVAKTSIHSIFRRKVHELWPGADADAIDKISVWTLD